MPSPTHPRLNVLLHRTPDRLKSLSGLSRCDFAPFLDERIEMGLDLMVFVP